MIIYCAADPIYFRHYFDLWAGQLNKFYSNTYKLIALYKQWCFNVFLFD